MSRPGDSPPATASRRGLLQQIFAACLGVVLAMLLGVTVVTVRPDPAADTRSQLETLATIQLRTQGALPAHEQVALEQEIRELRALARSQEDAWTLEVGAIVVVLASILLIGSQLARRAGLGPLSGDALLVAGGLLMVYGATLALMSAQTWLRVVVLAGAGLVTAIVVRARFTVARRAAGS